MSKILLLVLDTARVTPVLGEPKVLAGELHVVCMVTSILVVLLLHAAAQDLLSLALVTWPSTLLTVETQAGPLPVANSVAVMCRPLECEGKVGFIARGVLNECVSVTPPHTVEWAAVRRGKCTVEWLGFRSCFGLRVVVLWGGGQSVDRRLRLRSIKHRCGLRGSHGHGLLQGHEVVQALIQRRGILLVRDIRVTTHMR